MNSRENDAKEATKDDAKRLEVSALGAHGLVTAVDVDAAIRTAATGRLRLMEEDARFLSALGPEVGPELCRFDGCTRRHVALSVHCRDHHFRAIRGRAPGSE